MPQGITAGRVARASLRVTRWAFVMLRNGRLPAGAAALVLFGVLVYLLTDPQYMVGRIVVSGVADVPPATIAGASGVLGGNVFAVDTAAVARRVTRLAAIQQADVSLQSPDTLVIRVTERQPAAVWESGTERYLLDRNGVVLAALPSDRVPDLPRLTMAAGEVVPVVGQRLDATPVRSALALVSRLPTESGVTKAAIISDPLVGMIVQTERWRAVVGTDDQLGEKLAVLKVLLADPTWSDVDLRDPARVAVVRLGQKAAPPVATATAAATVRRP